MIRMLLVTTFLSLAAVTTAQADPCEGRLPTRHGETFAGTVRYVGDGDSLCVGRTSDPNDWIEVRERCGRKKNQEIWCWEGGPDGYLRDPVLVLDGDFRFEPGLIVTTAAAVSGLEFDAVVIPDLTPAFYPVGPELARSLYVAATRARDGLWLLTPDAWSPLVTGRDSV